MNPQEIKDLRLEKKLTQEKFADIFRVSKAAVSNWEKGIRSPSGSALKLLEELRNGDLIVTEISDLETKLLDQNVEVGKYRSREDYLTESLKYLLVHKKFMPLSKLEPSPLAAVAEDAAPYDGGSSQITDATPPPSDHPPRQIPASPESINVDRTEYKKEDHG